MFIYYGCNCLYIHRPLYIPALRPLVFLIFVCNVRSSQIYVSLLVIAGNGYMLAQLHLEFPSKVTVDKLRVPLLG